MSKVIIDLLLIFSALYIIRIIYSGIKTGKAQVRGEVIYKKNNHPLAYWTVLIGQFIMVVILLCLTVINHLVQK